jgi:hypothetical protein
MSSCSGNKIWDWDRQKQSPLLETTHPLRSLEAPLIAGRSPGSMDKASVSAEPGFRLLRAHTVSKTVSAADRAPDRG